MMKISACIVLLSTYTHSGAAASRLSSTSGSPRDEVIGASRLLKAVADNNAAVREAIEAPSTMMKSKFSSLFMPNNEELDKLFPATRRGLQDEMMMGDMMDDMCTPAVIYADDDDALTKFSDDYQPMCTCEDTSLAMDSFLVENPPPTDFSDLNGLTAWIAALNTVLNDAVQEENVHCANACNACFEDYCVLLEDMNSFRMELGLAQEITFADLAAIGLDANETEAEAAVLGRLLLESVKTTDMECVDVTSGPDVGKVCFSLMLDYNPEEPLPFTEFDPFLLLFNGTMSCALTYNGDDCNSCTLSGFTDFFANETCIAADCTNLVDGAMMSACDGEDDETIAAGFVGAFGPYFLLSVANETVSELTMGECVAMDMKTDAPTGAPSVDSMMTATETDAPTVSPTDEPVVPEPDAGVYFRGFNGYMMVLAALTAATLL